MRKLLVFAFPTMALLVLLASFAFSGPNVFDSAATIVLPTGPCSKVPALWIESPVSAPNSTGFSYVTAAPPPLSDDPPPPPGNSDAALLESCRPEQKMTSLRLSEVRVPLTPTDEQLVYAKREMGRATVIFDDPELHAPLFKNVSLFKRSYELMEKFLKVYIYKDGPTPLFHTPVLGGTYASEGWFMKLMQENEHFVVKDPSRAHLFYLPFSSLLLRKKLVVRWHRIEPMSIFLRHYVNKIAAKYPFWNRTGGADHFLVACHDWAPHAMTLHDELRKNSIKAVCNADASQGIFAPGKDVSLATTLVRTPGRPRRDLGGKHASKRLILAFFAGHMHGPVRPILLQHWKDRDKDMRIYESLPNTIARKTSYIQHMKSSKFCISARGYEVHTPRIVESIYYECVPVIIADNYVLPFDQVLDWSAFSLVVAERDIPNLRDILLEITPERYAELQMNVKKLKRHFLWNEQPIKYDIFHMILHSIWFSRLNQIQVQQ